MLRSPAALAGLYHMSSNLFGMRRVFCRSCRREKSEDGGFGFHGEKRNHVYSLYYHTHFIYFPASGQAVVTGVVPSSPRFCLQFLLRIGFSNLTARRFSSSVANSRSRAFRKSICAQKKVPTNFYEYALGGIRAQEIDLYHMLEDMT